jgi:hypothetical protein
MGLSIATVAALNSRFVENDIASSLETAIASGQPKIRLTACHDYCTFSAKSSTTNDVCNCESSAPTRYTWIVWPL